MPHAEHPRIREQLSKVMATIESEYPGKHVLLSGLAEGADRLAAHVALGRNWGLWAVLAFDRAHFEQDFPDAHAKGEFRALLASSQRVDEPPPGAFEAKATANAYDAVGTTLLTSSKVLIAIWDGAPSQGMGGTVEVIDKARRAGLPVVWIHATMPKAPRWLPPKGVRKKAATRMAASRSGVAGSK